MEYFENISKHISTFAIDGHTPLMIGAKGHKPFTRESVTPLLWRRIPPESGTTTDAHSGVLHSHQLRV